MEITDSNINLADLRAISMGDQARKVQKADGFGTEIARIDGSCTPFTPPNTWWAQLMSVQFRLGLANQAEAIFLIGYWKAQPNGLTEKNS